MTGLSLKRDDAAGDGFARAWSALSSRGFRIVVESDSSVIFWWRVDVTTAQADDICGPGRCGHDDGVASGSAPSLRVAARCARAVVRALERGA